MVIKVYFHDPSEKPFIINHQLKLFNPPAAAATTECHLSRVSQTCDKMIFTEPSRWTWERLQEAPSLSPQLQEAVETDFEEKEPLTLAAKRKVAREIEEDRARILVRNARVKEAMAEVTEELKAAEAAAAR